MNILKNKKILLLLLPLSFNLLLADVLDDNYNQALRLYKSERYEDSRMLLLDLAEEKYSNIFIYFLLGRVNRKLKDHDESIKYFEKYRSYDIPKKNEIATGINLAYEYLKAVDERKESFKKAKEIVDNLIKYEKDLEWLSTSLWKDVTYCYAIVYNNYGHYLLFEALERKESINYYKKIASMFEKALRKREEIVPIANNLARTYIRIIEIYLKEKDQKNAKYYIRKCNRLLKDYMSSNSNEKIFATKRDFEKQFRDYL